MSSIIQRKSFTTNKLACIQYSPPTKGFLSYLPSSWVHYAELIRLHKPAGILVTYFPHQSGSLFAACVTKPLPPPSSIATANLLLFVIAFVLRSVGCTCNDVVDRELDRHVARCCIRPVARGALSARAGYISAAVQYLILFSVMVPSSSIGLLYLAPVIIMGTLYPYAKRFTNYPQLILGLALSSGILVGSAVMKVDPMSLRYSNPALAFLSLIASYTVWTMISDTIYAFQDIRDDEKAGIKAMSVEHEDHIKPLLFTLAAIQIGLLGCTAVWLDAGWAFYFGVLSTAILLLRMVWSVDLDSPDAFWWWFKYGSLLVGGSLTFSLQGEYISRLWF